MDNLLQKHLDEVVKPCWNYANRITDEAGHWSNAALGLAGEAGEAADQVKKMLYHTAKDTGPQIQNLKSELGDVLFYWLRLVSFAGLTPEEVIADNRKKLSARHPEFFDKKEEWR
jgi:NTP pyrophosphatase (non-canonical NTP hydrolase)